MRVVEGPGAYESMTTTGGAGRFARTDALEGLLRAALVSPPTWEVRGPDVVLSAALGPGVRLEVVPLDEERVQARLEGVVTCEQLAAWVGRLPPSRPGDGSARPRSLVGASS